MFRIGTNTIMLLKGAAAGGKFDVMTKRLKGVYRDAAKGVAKTNDWNRFYERLHRLSKDEVSFMEMVFYREIADETPRLKEKILDQMFKCRIGRGSKTLTSKRKARRWQRRPYLVGQHCHRHLEAVKRKTFDSCRAGFTRPCTTRHWTSSSQQTCTRATFPKPWNG